MDWSKPEVIVACIAAGVSVAALATSIVSLVLTRRHNQAVLRPRLSFDFNIRPANPYARIVLSNRGLGPAEVTDYSFKIDGASPNDLGLVNIEDVTEYLGLPQGTIISFVKPPETIAPGQEIDLFSAPVSEYTPELAGSIRDGFRRVSYSVCYHSADSTESFESSVSGTDAFPAPE